MTCVGELSGIWCFWLAGLSCITAWRGWSFVECGDNWEWLLALVAILFCAMKSEGA